MAAPAPPVHTSPASPLAARPKQRRLGGLFSWISTKGCTHALKLRHSFKVDARTRMELGLDLDIVDEHGLQQMLHASAPWAALWYKMDPKDESKGCIEMTPLWVAYQRQLNLGRKGAWWAVPLDVKAGATYSGKPHIELGIGNLPLALGLAAALLAAGKPIGVRRKEVGGLAVQFGGAGGEWSLQERAEVDAQLRRDGRGLRLDFSQINGLLRMRQAD